MASRKFTVQAVVVGRKDFQETDKLIDLMTEYQGKIRGLAKGVRKINSRRMGSLELSNWVEVLLYQAKTFTLITEVNNLDSELGYRHDETKLGTMMYVCELTNHLLPEGQENKEAYQLLLKARSDIKSGNLNEVVNFEANLLKILGYGVQLSTRKLIKDSNYRLAHQELTQRIEDIIEHKLTSLEIFK